MTATNQTLGLYGQIPAEFDEFLCFGRECKKRKEERRRLKNEKKSLKNDQRRAETEQTRVETEMMKSAVQEGTQQTPTAYISQVVPEAAAAPQNKSQTLLWVGILGGALLIGGIIWYKTRSPKLNLQTNP